MEIIIRELDENCLGQINQCDNSFTVDAKLCLYTQDGEIRYTIAAIPPRQKGYPLDEMDSSTYLHNPDKAIFFAYVDGQLAGQVILRKNWNLYGYIEDICVEPLYRRHGIARRLLAHAAEWAKDKGLPGLMLETQNINVAGCSLYESFGFKLGGFDQYLYRAVMPGTDEVALYWYLMF
jgi:streptothricin acetyltransferase